MSLLKLCKTCLLLEYLLMKLNTVKVAATVVASLGALLAAPAHAGKTLDGIKTRGQIICGVHTGLDGVD